MDKIYKVGMDHCTIMNRVIKNSAEVFFPLGFVGDSNCREIRQEVRDAFVPSVRFVFDNAYVECAQFPPQVEEFYHFLTSEAGMHMTTLLTDNAESFRNALIAQGKDIPEIVVTEREGADHGEKKGKAVFHLVEIPFCAIPDTHMAYMEHLTRELLYQPGRWQHPNTVCRFDQVVLCSADEALLDRIGHQTEGLTKLANGDRCPGGMREFRMMDPASFKAAFGYEANEDRCIFSALVFAAEDMDACRACVEDSGLGWHERNGVIYVDAREKLSLVLCFQKA